MAASLKFVDAEYARTGGTSGNVLLDINDGADFCLDEIEFPPPKPRVEYRDPAHGDGKDVSRYKWENREITIKLNIYGEDKGDLSENLHALVAQLQVSNPILEWRADGWTNPLYIDLITPPLELNTPDWFVTSIRENRYIRVLPNVEILIEAKPFLRGPQETIIVAQGLGANDSFEFWNDPPTIPDDWVVTITGGGTVTAHHHSGEYLDGYYSVLLTTVAGSSVAAITDMDYLLVDENIHYNFRLYTKKLSGTSAIDVDVACYDDNSNLLGTLNLLVGDDVSTDWEDPIEKSTTTGVIHPSSETTEACRWPTGTKKVKRTIRNDSTFASSVAVDCAFFSQSEYFMRKANIGGQHANRVENPAHIHIPADDVKGDVVAPMEVYFEGKTVALWSSPVERGYVVPPYIGTIYFGRSANSNEDISLVLTPMPAFGSYVEEIGHIDQRYWHQGGTFVGTVLSPHQSEVDLDVDKYRGRYWPVLKMNETQESTVNLLLQTMGASSGYMPGNYNEDVYTWAITGLKDGDDYLYGFPIINIPPREFPPNSTCAGQEWALNLSIQHSVWHGASIDYLALIPIDYGFSQLFDTYPFFTTGSVMISDNGLYWNAYDSLECASLLPTDRYRGGSNINIDPNNGNNIVYLLTVGDTHSYVYFPCHPYFNFNVYIKYFPLYLLVPES